MAMNGHRGVGRLQTEQVTEGCNSYLPRRHSVTQRDANGASSLLSVGRSAAQSKAAEVPQLAPVKKKYTSLMKGALIPVW